MSYGIVTGAETVLWKETTCVVTDGDRDGRGLIPSSRERMGTTINVVCPCSCLVHVIWTSFVSFCWTQWHVVKLSVSSVISSTWQACAYCVVCTDTWKVLWFETWCLENPWNGPECWKVQEFVVKILGISVRHACFMQQFFKTVICGKNMRNYAPFACSHKTGIWKLGKWQFTRKNMRYAHFSEICECHDGIFAWNRHAYVR